MPLTKKRIVFINKGDISKRQNPPVQKLSVKDLIRIAYGNEVLRIGQRLEKGKLNKNNNGLKTVMNRVIVIKEEEKEKVGHVHLIMKAHRRKAIAEEVTV